MAEACGAGVPTFSIRFEDQEYDESGFARAVARRFSTDHHEFTVRNEGFRADLLQAVVTHHGQPTADSSAIPTFIVSRLARNSVKVALSGDGGDECFAGYSHYGWVRMIQRLQAWPGSVRSVSHGALKIVGSMRGLQQSDGIRQAANALEVSHAKPWFLPFEVLRINGEEALGQLLTQDAVTSGPSMGEDLSAWLIANRSADPIAQAQRFSFRYYLPDAYLAKVDRMSMANALEVRVPLLDHRVVEFALSFPGTVHWRGGQGKQLLRLAVADLLPAEVLAHRKQGFSIPMHRWATREYFALAEDILSEESVRRRGILQPVTVRNLLDRCQGRRMHLRSRESDSRLSHRLFALVVLEMWCRLYLDRLVERPSETARWDSALDVTSRA
jgi:asparagine synthase (glutamine-hydrolysing)